MTKRLLIASLALAAVAACTTVPTKDIKVTTDADPTVSFAGFKTYGLLGETDLINDAEGRWTGAPFDVSQRIQYLIDQQLGERGITRNTANADLLLVYGIGIDMDNIDLEIDEKTDYLTATNVPAGSLLIVLADSRTGVPVWVASASADIQEGADEETMQKRLDYAVKKMFEELPK
jgi:hypothetical protein